MVDSPDEPRSRKRRKLLRICLVIGGLAGAFLGLVTAASALGKGESQVGFAATTLGQGILTVLAMGLGVTSCVVGFRVLPYGIERLGSQRYAVINGAWLGALVTSIVITTVWWIFFTVYHLLGGQLDADHSIVEILVEVPIFGCILGVPAGAVLGILVGALVAHYGNRRGS